MGKQEKQRYDVRVHRIRGRKPFETQVWSRTKRGAYYAAKRKAERNGIPEKRIRELRLRRTHTQRVLRWVRRGPTLERQDDQMLEGRQRLFAL